MTEYSVFIGERKADTVFANSTLEAIDIVVATRRISAKGVWAMAVGVKK